MEWSQRVAIVTGGASGIGEATVSEFAARGVAVAIFDVNSAAYTVDVSDAAACQSAVQQVAERWQRIDFLVNDAVSFIAKGIDATTAEWESSLGVNVRGYANMVAACHPVMKKTGGAIVNLASISAHVAQPNRWTYNATKGAIVSMTKCQALDLSVDKIRVNSVSPGWIWTPEVQKAANHDRAKWEPIWGRYHMFLAGTDSRFVHGTSINVDGGYMGLGSEGLGDSSSFAGSE